MGYIIITTEYIWVFGERRSGFKKTQYDWITTCIIGKTMLTPYYPSSTAFDYFPTTT